MERLGALMRRTRRWLCAVSLLEHAALLLIVTGGLLLLWGIGDYLLGLPLAVRRLFFAVTGVIAGAVLARFIAMNRPVRLGDERIIRRIQDAVPQLGDRLLSAWQLQRRQPGISEELVGRLTEQVEAAVAGVSARDVCPVVPKLIHMAGAAGTLFVLGTALYFLPPYVLRPAPERILGSLGYCGWERYFSVEPGNGTYAPGSSVAVIVRSAGRMSGEPVLRIRSSDERWRREAMTPQQTGAFLFRIEQLTDRVDYAVTWGDGETPVFSLVPRASPQAGGFTLRYRYPAYTGMPPQAVEGTPNVTGIAGTRVEIRGRCNREIRRARVVTGQGTVYPVQTDGANIAWQMTLARSGTYRLLLEDGDGMTDPAPPVYDIAVVPDRVPNIEIVSPKEDLLVAPGAEIPLIVRAEDDFGVGGIDLVYQRRDGTAGRVAIAGGRTARAGVYEYLWRLEQLRLAPGEQVRYYVTAHDNDTVSGPKTTATAAQSLEVADSVKEHERIEEELKSVRQALVNVLADQTLAREKVKALEVAFSTAGCQTALTQQRAIRTATAQPAERLAAVLQRMAADSLTDFATYNEYKGLAAHLDYIRKTPMSAAIDGLEKRDLARARQEQDRIIAALEKMTLLSEDIWQYQRMRDLLEQGARLDRAGEVLERGASSEEVRRALQEVRDLLEKIQAQLAKLPHELPEDFVNDPSVRNVDMRTAQTLADALDRALAAGDSGRVRELAKELARQLAAVNKTLEDAGRDVGFSRDRSGDLAAEIRRRGAELEGLVKRQEGLLREAGRIDDNRRKALFRVQEELLARLEKIQTAAIAKADGMRQRLDRPQPALGWNTGRSLDLMRRVLEEFRQRRVFHAQKYLEDIIRQLGEIRGGIDAGKTALGTGYAALAGDAAALHGTEQDILNALRRPPGTKLLSADDEAKALRLSREQRALGSDTRKLRRSLDEFARKSAAVDPRVTDGMDKAAAAMDTAGGALAQQDTTRAMEAGQQALDYLEQSRQGMDESADGMGQQGRMSGTPAGSPIQVRTGNGATGWRSAPVALPRADEYRPPQEFRQEIMDALREKYPLQYEKMIKDYFRRLTE